jgi:hypothetical protein
LRRELVYPAHPRLANTPGAQEYNPNATHE